MMETDPSKVIPEFSLVKGGLFYRFLRSLKLCDEKLEPIYRRLVVFAALTWLPMLLLSMIDGRGNVGVDIPFLRDVENHARFLVALPLMLAAETLLERLLSPRIRNFIHRKIILDSDLERFRSAITSAVRMRDNIAIELFLLITVYALGSYFYGSLMASASGACSTWYATPADERWNLTLAGYWLVFVSLPIFQFIFVRWYFRIVIWFIFLFRVSRLDLNLLPTHSDRAAGLGFLNKCSYAFSYWMIAQGVILSGFVAGQVLHFGTDPREYKLEAAGVVILVLISVLSPLALFAPKLIQAKWERGGDFGTFASDYVEKFNSKWILRDNPTQEQLLGTSDLQSLADLGNSFSVIDQTKTVPFSVTDVFYMAMMTLMPLLPLLLFIFSVEELLDRLIKMFM